MKRNSPSQNGNSQGKKLRATKPPKGILESYNSSSKEFGEIFKLGTNDYRQGWVWVRNGGLFKPRYRQVRLGLMPANEPKWFREDPNAK